MYARIENDTVAEWPILNIRQRLPHISFPTPVTDEALPEGFVRVHSTPMPAASAHQNVSEQSPVFADGKWVQSWKVLPASKEEAQARIGVQIDQARQQRAQAYSSEADPLYFQWQRGEATQGDWLNKIAEIKQRYPMPTSETDNT